MLTSTLPRLKHASPQMGAIDHLKWTDGISFISYGAHMGIRTNHRAMLVRLTKYLPPGWKPASSPVVDSLYSLWIGEDSTQSGMRGRHRLYAGAESVKQSPNVDEILEALESCLHFDTALGARNKLFVHAGVVGWGGQAIIIPGRSFSGKTSLVAALVRAGATYYSDEYAVLDARGRVHPYPKPLSLRGENGEPARKCSVEALGGQAGIEPLAVGLVAATLYTPGARWHPHPLSPGQAMLALFDNTVLARREPEAALDILLRVVTRAFALRGQRGEAAEVVAALLDCLSRGPVAHNREKVQPQKQK